jgi:Zn-dependent protease
MDTTLVIFQIVILVFAVIIHEVSHGVVALSLGDPTAKLSGRLTLNPIPHIDIYGSIILPLLMGLASGGAFVFGYAKPVPFNPYLLRDQKWAPALVALAGPASNLVLAILLGIFYRIATIFTDIPAEVGQLFAIAVVINIVLAVFNSVPIPPLDGSKIIAPMALAGPASNLVLAIFLGLSYRIAMIFTTIPEEVGQLFAIAVIINIVLAVFNAVPIPPLVRSEFYAALEQNGMWIVLIFVFFDFRWISSIILGLANLILG